MTKNTPYHPANTKTHHEGFLKLLFGIATVDQNEDRFSREVFS